MHWIENDLWIEEKKGNTYTYIIHKHSNILSAAAARIIVDTINSKKFTCPLSSSWWLVSLSLSKLTTCFIHWAPLAGESGCTWILNKNIQDISSKCICKEQGQVKSIHIYLCISIVVQLWRLAMRLIYDFTQQINSQFTYIKRELITHTVALKNKQLLLVCGTSNEGVVIEFFAFSY